MHEGGERERLSKEREEVEGERGRKVREGGRVTWKRVGEEREEGEGERGRKSYIGKSGHEEVL